MKLDRILRSVRFSGPLPATTLLATGLLATALLASCGGGAATTSEPPAQPLSVAAVAGKALFHDVTLSASGVQSCATCHVQSRAFTADPVTDHNLPVPLGGAQMNQTGFRNAPSLSYASYTPPFSMDDGPVGGFFRDGRASGLDTQAQQPFVTSFEMANADAAEVIGRLRNSPDTLSAFVAVYGAAVLDDPDTAPLRYRPGHCRLRDRRSGLSSLQQQV